MVIFPNCKINIGLNIVRKREDGYHDLETVFYPVPVHDVLEVVQHHEDAFVQTGLTIDGDSSNNLCVKALQLVRSIHPDLPLVKMHLHKTIPMGAGLGGGSSDGAHTLLLLNKKFGLGFSQSQLIEMALQLGSDCPFFIVNQPCFAWSRGEIMEPLSLPLSGYQLVLINPGIHVNTGWAFKQITPQQPAFSLQEMATLPVKEWKPEVKNDFEKAVGMAHPTVAEIVHYAYTNQAVYAAMSGSGSTCFALFEGHQTLPDFSPFSHCWIRKIKLS